MSFNEDQLLQSGIDAITKAFTMKKGNSKSIITEQKLLILDLQSKISLLENKNVKLQSDISILRIENQQLNKHNNKLQSFINDNQKKFNEINSLSDSNGNSNNNTQTINCNSNIIQQQSLDHTKPKKEKGGKLTLNNVKNKIMISQLSNGRKKPSVDMPLTRNHNYSHNGFISHRNNYSMNIMNTNSTNDNANDSDNSRYTRIDTKISQIKRNLVSRDNSRNRDVEEHQANSNLRNNKNKDFTTNNSSALIGDNRNKYLTVNNEKHCSNETYNNNINEEDEDNNNSTNKNSNYRGKIDFLNKCNMLLDPKNFERILSLFERIKNNDIQVNDALPHIKKCLQNNSNLLNLLDSVFQ